MGRITLPEPPQPKGKRRWGWLLVCSLLMFAGGVAAGPVLTDHASVLVEHVAPMLGMSVPKFAENRRPAAHAVAPVPAPVPVLEPAPATAKATASEELGEAPIIAAKPAVIPAAAKPEPEQPVVAPAPREPVEVKRIAMAPARENVAKAAERPGARPQRGKGAAKVASAAGTRAGAHKVSDYQDPFAADDDEGSAKAAAPSGKSKPAEPEAAAKSDLAPKPTAAKSHDSLDSLMADGVGDSKSKKRESKDLDALLKDVQKSKPEPPPKREAPPPAAALSPSDISRVMAVVKTRANSCAQRLGQTGIAELKITVSKVGAVTDVQLGGKVANTPLAACIEKATRAAVFPPSTGLRFDYRIDAR